MGGVSALAAASPIDPAVTERMRIVSIAYSRFGICGQ